MDKEKEIEDMAAELCGMPVGGFGSVGTERKKIGLITAKEISSILINAGYGNIKQAVKEFAEKLKEKQFNVIKGERIVSVVSINEISELIKELYGDSNGLEL